MISVVIVSVSVSIRVRICFSISIIISCGRGICTNNIILPHASIECNEAFFTKKHKRLLHYFFRMTTNSCLFLLGPGKTTNQTRQKLLF